ncbi:aldo/keto reductase [Listeria booriae]|uniref:Aldo/keto reductase n=1 Tax=Listeria booriae TaxID=1552123 RepID=A0A099WEW1_9LIST|nr:aldo/keto reductase [Listeria booriae]KGL43517.1 glyoxal reductase [Listeria booriae]MBC1230325.1 aldo/keto reductase [Listeria booriae]MBC1794745.1 aldo/keto reductase [Listeria booriae]MBC1803099.1 aldo/keto reductase [Listeria booriae]MBC1943676.1 aldo/keto reductase [Listeria booriae]
MDLKVTDTKKFHNGQEIPLVGLGVWKMRDEKEAIEAIQVAIESGYRAIDTAKVYENEEYVGQAIREAGIAREALTITSKLWNADHGYDETLRAFDTTLKKLQLDYLDLYLIHWPVLAYKDSWRAMERLYNEGLIKSIGVSNFHQHHLENLFTTANEKPVIDQIEIHPLLSQKPLKAYLESQDIVHEAWSPLAQGGELLTNQTLQRIADKYNITIPQVILRWHLNNGSVIIPKSVTPERIRANIDLFGFDLAASDMAEIDALNKDERKGSDPDSEEFLARVWK